MMKLGEIHEHLHQMRLFVTSMVNHDMYDVRQILVKVRTSEEHTKPLFYVSGETMNCVVAGRHRNTYSEFAGLIDLLGDIVQEISKGRFIPIFVVGECLVCVSLWLGFAIKFVTERGGSLTAQLAGLDSVQPGLFDLRTSDADCRDLRPEAPSKPYLDIGRYPSNLYLYRCR